MSTRPRLAVQQLVSGDEDDVLMRLVGWISHEQLEVIARRGGFRSWHFSDLTGLADDAGC